MSKFGKLIKQLRNNAGLTLHEVAEALDVKVSYLSDVEHGRKKPFSPESILKFSGLVKTDYKELQKLALAERNSIEIPIKAQNSKINDLAFALARSADSGVTQELKDELRKFLAEEEE